MELALKALLLAKGWTTERVKKELGHNLGDALTEAKNNGLDDLASLSSEQEAEIRAASDLHWKKKFQYFEFDVILEALKGLKDRPDCETLEAACRMILDGIRETCMHAK